MLQALDHNGRQVRLKNGFDLVGGLLKHGESELEQPQQDVVLVIGDVPNVLG